MRRHPNVAAPARPSPMRTCAYYRQPFNECPVSTTMARHLLSSSAPLCGRRDNTVQNPDTRSPIADHLVPSAAPGEDSNEHEPDTDNEMIGFDCLALGVERIGGLGAPAAPARKGPQPISLASPYKTTALDSG